MKQVLSFFTLLLLHFQFILAQQNIIYGTVKDSSSNETIPGAIVYIEGTNISTATDIDGNFTLKLFPGKYNLICSYITYNTYTTSIIVKKDSIRLNILLTPEKNTTLNEITILADKILNNDAGLAIMQKENKSVSDGISAELIKKTADRTTSDVLKRVSGVSIVNNKFVVIRGLNERYNLSFLNNAPLPSTESDKRAFSFDLIPSQIIDNIIINKTATPDLPADFGGGNIFINTKSIPDKNFMEISSSIGYNTLATNKTFNNYDAGKYHIFGWYDNSQNIPSSIPENPKDWITSTQQVQMAKNFKNDFQTHPQKIFPNISFNLTGGWTHTFKNNHKWGFIYSQNYNNNFNKFEVWRTNYTNNPNNDADVMLDDRYNISTTQNIVMNTSLLNIGYKINPQHQINFKNMLLLHSNKSNIEQYGTIAPLDSNRTVDKNTALFYTNTKIFSSQLNFENNWETIGLKTGLNLGYSNINIITPNVRYMSYSKFVRIQNYPDPSEPPPSFIKDTMYAANISNASTGPEYAGYRFFSKMNEDIRSIKYDIEKNINISKVKLTLQTGYYFQQRQRNFDIRQFGYAKYTQIGKMFDDSLLYLPPDQIFSEQNIGVLPNNKTGFKLIEVTKPSDKYYAYSNNHATYLMSTIEWKFLKIIGGVRYEFYHQYLFAKRNHQDTITINDKYKNILPSVNVIFNLNEKNAIRFCYSQTLNRPEFRELAPASWYNPVNRLLYYGNDTLLPSTIHNFDIRYEWYPGMGQMLTFTPFYKYFIKPIEQVMSPGYTNEITWANAEFAKLYGIESEYRLQLSTIFKNKKDSNNIFEKLSVFTNVALMKSEVTLPDNIYAASKKRNLQGQSPFIINTGMTFFDKKTKWKITLAYNRSGRRIIFAGNQRDPDRYETGRDVLDFQISKTYWNDKLEIKFNIRDILHQYQYVYQNADADTRYNKQSDYTILKISYPTIYQINISYKF
ncbi:MAG: TonB-dependent receptor [Bacteroidetes bacterium]|nr:MAG: TonB-dependent receptor [Bacteroidota bacterium]